jgi:hypothetical protein
MPSLAGGQGVAGELEDGALLRADSLASSALSLASSAFPLASISFLRSKRILVILSVDPSFAETVEANSV